MSTLFTTGRRALAALAIALAVASCGGSDDDQGGDASPTPAPTLTATPTQATPLPSATASPTATPSPPNTTPANAEVILELPFTAVADTLLAPGSTIEHSCGPFGAAAWYRLTAESDGFIRVSTGGSTYDTVLSAWTGSPGPEEELACNDDADDETSMLVFEVASGMTYYLLVTSFDGRGGDLALEVSRESGTPPENVTPATAEAIAELPFAASVDTTLAAESSIAHSCGPVNAAVWYSFTAEADGFVRATTAGSTYDTVLSAWAGSPDAPDELVCNDDADAQTSLVVFAVEADVTYYLLASAFGIPGGELALEVTPESEAPPTHVTPASAEVIAGLPFATIIDTVVAPRSAITHSCGPSDAAVWYRFTAEADGLILATTAGSTYDTVLSAWAGSPDAPDELACNDDAGGQTSRLVFGVEAGLTYFLQIASFEGVGGGLTLEVTRELGTPPGNVTPGSAAIIPGLPFVSVISTDLAAGAGAAPSCGPSAAAVWYQLTIAFDGLVAASTAGSAYDTVLSLWTGSPDSLDELACNDDDAGGTSRLVFEVEAGVTYYLQVTSYDGLGGELTLEVTAADE